MFLIFKQNSSVLTTHFLGLNLSYNLEYKNWNFDLRKEMNFEKVLF